MRDISPGPGEFVALKDADLEILARHLFRELLPVLQTDDFVIEPRFRLDEVLQGADRTGLLRALGHQAPARADLQGRRLLALLALLGQRQSAIAPISVRAPQ